MALRWTWPVETGTNHHLQTACMHFSHHIHDPCTGHECMCVSRTRATGEGLIYSWLRMSGMTCPLLSVFLQDPSGSSPPVSRGRTGQLSPLTDAWLSTGIQGQDRAARSTHGCMAVAAVVRQGAH